MNQEQIKTLIDALAASDLSELEYSENGCTLRLMKQSARTHFGSRSNSCTSVRRMAFAIRQN